MLNVRLDARGTVMVHTEKVCRGKSAVHSLAHVVTSRTLRTVLQAGFFITGRRDVFDDTKYVTIQDLLEVQFIRPLSVERLQEFLSAHNLLVKSAEPAPGRGDVVTAVIMFHDAESGEKKAELESDSLVKHVTYVIVSMQK